MSLAITGKSRLIVTTVSGDGPASKRTKVGISDWFGRPFARFARSTSGRGRVLGWQMDRLLRLTISMGLALRFGRAGHAEGKAAIWMRENGVADAVFYHNNPIGTCNWCHPQISTLLPEGASMLVVPPAGTVIPGPRWHIKPDPYVGNSRIPKTSN